MAEKIPLKEKPQEDISRKGFLRSVFALGGLTLSYGALGLIVLRYLWPYKQTAIQKIFVADKKNLHAGHTVTFSTPDGESYLLTYRESEGKKEYLAYSNRCPHLGCKVIWEQEKSRFFCPCHGGVFNESGIATAGPPAKAKQRLKKCEIEVVDNAVYAVLGKSS